ncbi:MAG TPA: MmcQ/YjbR family DNA-binding protein [Ilumatobacteraceae bacterium]|nr:MmcQ/YjbR family DNA-binding protein [Ilumatobacteraceae bacterium]
MDLDDVRELVARLPATSESPHFDLTSFRVGTKIFATAPLDGDHVRIFVDEGEVAACVEEDPATFEALRWGQRVAGVAVRLAAADPTRVGELLEDSWRRRAPKRVVAAFDAAS